MRSRVVLAAMVAVVIAVSGLGSAPAMALSDHFRPDRTVQTNTGAPLHAAAGQRTGLGYKVLFGVNAEARDEVFAVGVGGSDDLLVRAWRFDGRQWALDQPPGAPPSEFRSVTPVLEDGTAWGVGAARWRALVAQWDGTTWTQVPTPSPEPGERDYLDSVDAAGPDDIWAVGHTWVDYPVSRVPLAMHWDGTEWSKVDIPTPKGNDSTILHGVSVISADDVWAVGDALLVHWDGSEWTPYTGSLDDGIYLRGIDAVASDDIWAVGSASGREWGLLHWNGRKWRQFHAPVPPGEDWSLVYLLGVTAIGPNDVWAVGSYGYRSDYHAQTMHWNGNKWRKIKSPQPGSQDNSLNGVSGSGPDDVYAVGTFADWDDPGSHHLIQHWDGDRWTRVHPQRD